MLKDFFRSKYFLIIFVSAIAVILMLLSFNSSGRQPSLITANPANGFSKLSVIGPITLVFDSVVSPEDIVVTSNPQAEFNVARSNEYSLVLAPLKPLAQNTPHTITISSNNQVLQTLTYKTEETQTDYEMIDKIKEEIARDFPVAAKIPHETENYKVVYSSPLTLEISLKNNSLSEDQAISQVKSWVTSAGGDADLHKYVVVPSSQ